MLCVCVSYLNSVIESKLESNINAVFFLSHLNEISSIERYRLENCTPIFHTMSREELIWRERCTI